MLKANPGYPGAIDTLAAIQLSQSHVDQAIEDLTREAAAKPEELGTRLLLAQAHMAKGDLAAAEADLKNALPLATDRCRQGHRFAV